MSALIVKKFWMTTMDREFSPSINLNRDVENSLTYVATANAQRAYHQILNDFPLGIHSFSLIGSYGTGKSIFLVAFEQTLKRFASHFPAPNGHFSGASHFEFINFVGMYASIFSTLANYLDVQTETELWAALDTRCRDLKARNGCLVIVVDEFGKFLEYAAQVNPEKELYFIQQLAEYVNGQGKNAALLVTLHQNFSAYSGNLDRNQRQEWEKVKGRLKELTFNEPVEQLLELAAAHISTLNVDANAEVSDQLFRSIEDSRAFPHRGKLHNEFAQRLRPFDLLAASVMTQALQRYGQNERSLFTFLNANDHLGLHNFDRTRYRFYNLVCVYDYLVYNYHSLLSSVQNPHYIQWGAIQNAIERAEASISSRLEDILCLVKVIGLLNIFAPQGAKINERFLKEYITSTMDVPEIDSLLQELEEYKIVRFVRFKESFVLFEGTDLNIESALLEASSSIAPINDVTPHLHKYFSFPIVFAKAVSYQTGTPRFFEYHLSTQPIDEPTKNPTTDGVINLVFSESLNLETLLQISTEKPPTSIYCWYQSAKQIRELLYAIEKTLYVENINSNDRVALRELQNLRAHQTELLNQHVLQSMFATDGSVQWVWNGKLVQITEPASLNSMLSAICCSVFSKTPIFHNELVNRNGVSSAVATARKAYFRALVDYWRTADLGFDLEKYPPEKTIYLTLLRQTEIHRFIEEQWELDAPTDPSFQMLWHQCELFLESARVSPKTIVDLVDDLLQPPFGLKQGFIDFWVPTFLFIRRESFTLHVEGRFQPELTAETLDLIRISPQKFQVKSFSIDGVKLRFFNRCRALLKYKNAEHVTTSGFLETIKPFITFYSSLTGYAKQTQRVTQPTLRLREAIANAKDPERTFFEDFPTALGFLQIAEEQTSDSELEAYINQLQKSIHELQSIFDLLVDRVEAELLALLGVYNTHFPEYKSAIELRFRNLQTYLLLPKQKTIYLRLTSPLEDRTSWISAVGQGILGRDLRQISDEDEVVLFARLREAIQELDNLCELDKLDTDFDNDANAIRIEITKYGTQSQKLLHRLPKQKEELAVDLHVKLKHSLTEDMSVNTAALIRLLQETLNNG